jgi:hypothetical protein
MNDFYQFLADYNIEYETHNHPAVYTVSKSFEFVLVVVLVLVYVIENVNL